MSRIMSKIGLRFGRWLVQELASTNPTKWRCICDCGTVKEVIGTNLRSPGSEMSKSFGSRSCGCYRNELAMGRAKTHGYASSGKASRTYRLWASMLHRTRNKTADPVQSTWIEESAFANDGFVSRTFFQTWASDLLRPIQSTGSTTTRVTHQTIVGGQPKQSRREIVATIERLKRSENV